MLWQAYPYLRGAYKYLSTVNPIGDIWCIGTNVLSDFVSKCNLIDNLLGPEGVGLKFVATKVDPNMPKSHRNPERGLIRYQFMEFFVRISDERYLSKKVVATLPEAVEKVLNEHLIPYIKPNEALFNPQKWREEQYWNEECDTVLKSYLPILQDLYSKYSGAKSKPGMKKFVSLEELQRLATEAAILDDNLVERDIVVAYNLSMMTQLDELNSDRIFQMSFVEFLEALARISNVAACISPGENDVTTQLLT